MNNDEASRQLRDLRDLLVQEVRFDDDDLACASPDAWIRLGRMIDELAPSIGRVRSFWERGR